MKRIFSLLLCVILLFSLSLCVLADETAPETEAEETANNETEAPAEGGAEDAESPAEEVPAEEKPVVEISSSLDLLAIASDPAGNYVLTADINMQDVAWAPIAFSGKLDGAGHCIYNLKITEPGATTAETFDGNDKSYFTFGCGLFSILNEAEISNLTIRGEQITAEPDSHCFVGGLAGIITKSKITDCAVYDARMTLEAHGVHSGIGGLVGYAAGGLLRGCKATTVLVFLDLNDEETRCEEFLAGAVASGYVTIDSCDITLDGYCSCHGYVHNGGLMGMFDVPNDGTHADYIARNIANGTISFFENNPDRRAYCQPFVGELLTYAEMFDNTNNFVSNEVFDYSVNLLPEKCAQATLTTEVVEPSCEEWGCTVHRCSVCNYQWRDTFVPAAHTEGEWVVTKEASLTEGGEKELHCALCDAVMETVETPHHTEGEWVVVEQPEYGKEGLRELHCGECDAILKQEEIPALKPVKEIILSADTMELSYKTESKIYAAVDPQDAANTVVIFSSTNPEVVSVDTDGSLHANGKGEADILCVSGDGYASSTCHVIVNYTAPQWIVHYVLFGWLWD